MATRRRTSVFSPKFRWGVRVAFFTAIFTVPFGYLFQSFQMAAYVGQVCGLK